MYGPTNVPILYATLLHNTLPNTSQHLSTTAFSTLGTMLCPTLFPNTFLQHSSTILSTTLVPTLFPNTPLRRSSQNTLNPSKTLLPTLPPMYLNTIPLSLRKTGCNALHNPLSRPTTLCLKCNFPWRGMAQTSPQTPPRESISHHFPT